MKINNDETLIEFYIRNKNKENLNLIIAIINSVCISHYENLTPEFNKEVSDFVVEFKKENSDFIFKNQEMPVFKIYQENIVKNIKNIQKQIDEELAIEKKNEAYNLASKIFNLHYDFAYSIAIDDKSYLQYPSSIDNFTKQLKLLLHNSKGIIILYFMIKNEKFAVGYSVKNGKFSAISPKILENINKDKNIKYTEINKIEFLIKKEQSNKL